MLLLTRAQSEDALLSHFTDEETEAQIGKHCYHLSIDKLWTRFKCNEGFTKNSFTM